MYEKAFVNAGNKTLDLLADALLTVVNHKDFDSGVLGRDGLMLRYLSPVVLADKQFLPAIVRVDGPASTADVLLVSNV